MISMFSKIKNHALATGYGTKTSQPTSTTNTTTVVSSSSDQSSSKASKTSTTTVPLNSISSTINSLQNACASNYSTDQQVNYGRVSSLSKVSLLFFFFRTQFKLLFFF